jgi:hypothetical protein
MTGVYTTSRTSLLADTLNTVYTAITQFSRHVPIPHVFHVFRVKRDFVTGIVCFLLILVGCNCAASLDNQLLPYTYTFTSTYIYTINQSSTMSTQQQSSLKSLTTDEVAKVSFHPTIPATI